MAGAKSNDRKVTTPKFRVSFPWVFEPQAPMAGSESKDPKYGVVMLFDTKAQQTPEYEKLKALAVAAAKDKFGDKLKADGKGWFKLGGKALKNPLRDGEEKSDLEGYGEGVFFASATSKMQPGLVDSALNRIIKKDDFYAGCYARATVTAYGFDKAGNVGVAFGLQNLQKIGDGESFSGRVAAENDFDSVEDAFGEEDEGGDEGGGDHLK